jgi:hypothetical protein
MPATKQTKKYFNIRKRTIKYIRDLIEYMDASNWEPWEETQRTNDIGLKIAAIAMGLSFLVILLATDTKPVLIIAICCGVGFLTMITTQTILKLRYGKRDYAGEHIK